MDTEHNTSESSAPQPMPLMKTFSTPMAIVLAGAIIAGAIIFTGRPMQNAGFVPSGNPQDLQPTMAAVDASKVTTDGDPIIGAANAPVTIAYWFDYQCPFCKKNELESITQVLKEYVATGKVRIIYKDFQFLGPDSDEAGIMGRAVWEAAPQKYLLWHTAMFQSQDDENGGWGNKADIETLTKTSLGTDAGKAIDMANSNRAKYMAELDADKKEGSSMNVNGTPAMIINKEFINGADSYANIKAAIEKALKS